MFPGDFFFLLSHFSSTKHFFLFLLRCKAILLALSLSSATETLAQAQLLQD